MKRQMQNTTTVRTTLVAGLVTFSLGACPLSVRAAGVHAKGHAALLAKETASLVESSETWTTDDIKQLLGTLSYAGNDVPVSLDEVYVESRDGRLIIWHTYEIPYWEDVPEVMQRESRRCLALAVALHGSSIENTWGGTSPFESVTWVLNDGHDNNYFALVDDGDVAYTGTRALDLFPQSDGFVLSDTIYVSISRRESGIPPRSGLTPCDIEGNPIVCEGWLSVPDELWLVGLPETSENTDDSGYWYEGEIEIDSPSTWYEEFKEEEEETDVIIIEDEGDENTEGPVAPIVIDPDSPGTDDPVDPDGPPQPINPDDPGTDEPTDPDDPGTGGEVTPGGEGGEGGEGGGDTGGDDGGDIGGGGDDGGGDIGGGDTGGDGGGDTGGDGGGEGGGGLLGAGASTENPGEGGSGDEGGTAGEA